MAFIRRSTAVVEEPADSAVVERRHVAATTASWSPAQIVALVVGIGFVVLGIVAVTRTGFNTDHIYRPQDLVWKMPHSPLLGVCEIAFGALMVIAGVVPGGLRGLIAFLGAFALALGIVVLVQRLPNRLHDWLGVTHRSGVLFIIVGGASLVAAVFGPTFIGTRHESVREQERAGSYS